MDNALQSGECLRVAKNQIAQLLAVDFTLGVEDPIAEGGDHWIVARRPPGHRPMGK
jgi:hypothetical protein